jgi:hypothetical protein
MNRRTMAAVTLLPLVPLVLSVRAGWLRGAGLLGDLALPATVGLVVFFGTSWLADRLLGGDR